MVQKRLGAPDIDDMLCYWKNECSCMSNKQLFH